jgi:GTP cyclohydrolase I
VNNNLPDMQKTKDGFPKISIGKVGVRNLKIQLPIKTKTCGFQDCTVTVSSYCNLVEDVKGINMSRISRTLLTYLERSQDGVHDLSTLAKTLQTAHATDNIYVKAIFNYFVEKSSPVTKINYQEPIVVIFESTLFGGELKNYLTVRVAGMSLCPCSKEMSLLKNNISPEEYVALSALESSLFEKVLHSGFGAHNQQSFVEIKTLLNDNSAYRFWIEDAVSIADSSFSCPTYSVLKREDEKFVTEKSYANPRFVEDIARINAEELFKILDSSILDFVVVVNNMESIHNDIQATAILNAGRFLT